MGTKRPRTKSRKRNKDDEIVWAGPDFDMSDLPPRSEWIGMTEGEKRLPGEPAPQTLRRYCDPERGIVISQNPLLRLVCRFIVDGQRIYVTREKYATFMSMRKEWRLKRKVNSHK